MNEINYLLIAGATLVGVGFIATVISVAYILLSSEPSE